MMSEPLRYSIKEPILEIFQAWELLSSAAKAHLNGNYAAADALFRQANLSEIWHWVNPAWVLPHLNVRVPKPEGDSQIIPKNLRDPVRDIRRDPKAALVRAAVLARDGYRCRYCGIPVIDADIWKICNKLYPDAVPWHGRDPRKQHAAFQCFWLQYDHIVPHSHGGASSEENVVVSCALCNFGKDKYTLRQLAISDPRLRPPERLAWDGLECLRTPMAPRRRKVADVKAEERSPIPFVPRQPPTPKHFHAFFLPGAWISGEYLYSPPIAGKERWFKIGQELVAESAIRNGVRGCRLLCDPEQFQRRGLSPEEFLDPEEPL